MYVYMCVYTHAHVYLYREIERKRETETERGRHTNTYIVHIHTNKSDYDGITSPVVYYPSQTNTCMPEYTQLHIYQTYTRALIHVYI